MTQTAFNRPFTLLAVFLALWTTGCTSGPFTGRVQTAPKSIQGLSVNRHPGWTEIVLTGSQPIAYFSFTLTDPDRLIVDLPQTSFHGMNPIMPMDKGVLNYIQMLNGKAPDFTGRMELSLAHSVKTRVRADGNRLTIEIDKPAKDDPKPRRATRVSNLSVQTDPEELRIVVTGNGILKPKAFLFKKKYLVVDLPGVTNRAIPGTILVDDPMITKIRVGQHNEPKKVRVVLHLAQPVSHKVRTTKRGVIITVRPGG